MPSRLANSANFSLRYSARGISGWSNPISSVALEAGQFEDALKALSDEQLKAKTAEFKASHCRGHEH